MDHVLTHIYEEPVTVKDIVTYLKVVGVFSNAVHKLMELHTVRHAIQELNIVVEDEELQSYLESKRRLAGLAGVAELNRYCHQHGILWQEWKEVAEGDFLRDILKRKVIDETRIQSYFEQNREQLKKLCIARIVCREFQEAEDIKVRALGGEGDFSVLARKHSLEHNSRIAGGHLGCMGYGVLPAEIEQDLFSAATGAICGPYAQNDYWVVYHVEEILHATLTDDARQQIANKLFSDWLRERVSKAQQ